MTKLSPGTVHTLPSDMIKALVAKPKAVAAWEDISALARNEWICWVISVKKEETRKEHITRLVNELQEGKRRPCCWIGCIHRTDKKLSPSVKAIVSGKFGSKKK